jgi:hypothetical protein
MRMAADGESLMNASDIADAVENSSKNCGLIMPIAECDGCSPAHWLEVRSIIVSAVATIGAPKFKTKMVSDGEATGTIQGRIVRNVYNNEIVVCDVSGRNPNVLFELGLRIAFDRPVVLIKDDATDFAFDIGPLEHLVYPRSLRHAPMEQFKLDLATKVAAIHNEWYSTGGDKPSYIKAFGPITTVEFERKTEGSDQAILEALAGIHRRIDLLERPIRRPVAGDAFRRPMRSELGVSGAVLFEGLSKGLQQHLIEALKNEFNSSKSVPTTWLSKLLARIAPDQEFTPDDASALMEYIVMKKM